MFDTIRARPAAAADLDRLTELFDAYRVFYQQRSDRPRARAFIEARLDQRDAVILLAETEAGAVGFTQLFPSFSSVATGRIWILNDLYVAPQARRGGVAAALLEAARAHALETGAVRLVLETSPDNRAAQALYEKLGWLRDEAWHYRLELTAG